MKTAAKKAAGGQSGFSLMEVLIASAILSILIMATIATMSIAQEMFDTGTAVADGEAIARRALDDISYELYSSSITTLSPANPNASTYIRFQKNIDFVAGVIVWSDPIQIEWVMDPKEIDNGLDDDGDGLIDEGYIRIWEDAVPTGMTPGAEDSTPITIARSIAENGLEFDLTGTRLDVLVTSQKLDARRNVINSEATTTIALRN